MNYDYIGATGEYSISDYIDITSNTLNNKIDELTSNTYHININNSNCLINTSNTNDYINGSLIDVDNTYIYNNYQYGEIRFKIKDDDKIYVKVGRDGKLYLWITYNFLRPEILEGWYEVSDILSDYFFNLAIINFTLTAYGGDLVYLQSQITTIGTQILSLVDITYIHTFQINKLIELQEASLVDSILSSTILDPLTAYQQITARGINSISRISTSSSALLGFGGAGLFSWIAVGTYGYFSQLAQERREKRERLNNIYGELLINSNTCNLDVPDINNPGKSLRESLYNNIYDNLSNINYQELTHNSNMIKTLGFINSNITTQQLIPSLRTSNLNLISGDITDVNTITSLYGDYSNLTTSNLYIHSNLNIKGSIIGGTANFSNIIINNNLNASGSIILKLPNTGFIYDSLNNFYVYDLNISTYIPFKLIQQSPTLFIKTRIFNITSIMSTNFQDLETTNLKNLTNNAICFPETLTIYMSNDKIVNSIHIAAENYCNGIIYGKQNNNINGGYWGIVPDNFNYIRLISGVGFDTTVIIQPLLL